MRRSCWFNTTTCHIAKLSWQCEHIQLKIMVLLKIVYLQQYSVHKYVFTYTIAWGCWEYGVLKKWIILNQEISHFQGFYSQWFFFVWIQSRKSSVPVHQRKLQVTSSYWFFTAVLFVYSQWVPAPDNVYDSHWEVRQHWGDGYRKDRNRSIFKKKNLKRVMHRKLGSQRHRVRDKSWKCKYKLIRKLLFFPDDRHSAALTCFWLVSRSGFDLKVTLWHKSVLAH